jgi:hypothetical protein
VFSLRFMVLALHMLFVTNAFSANKTVRLDAFVVQVPLDPRWQSVPSKNNSQLTYLLVDKGEWRALMLVPVDLQQKIPNDSVLMTVAKKLVAITGGDLAKQRGLSLDKETYSYVKHEKSRCVKVNTVSTTSSPVNAGGEKLWATFLICSRPEFEGRLGYIAAHSYVRPELDRALEDEAKKFFDEIKVTRTP